jgi:hypothetical protein
MLFAVTEEVSVLFVYKKKQHNAVCADIPDP